MQQETDIPGVSYGFLKAGRVQEDTELICFLKQAAAGNSKAFECFYYRTVNKVNNYIRLKIQDIHLVNDIVQEVYCSIWKNASSFHEQSKITTWLISITKNKIADHYRKRNLPYQEIELTEESSILPEEDFSLRLNNKILLQKLIKDLDPASREILYLVFYLNMTYKEVAQILKTHEGTIKSRMYYLKGKLKEEIAKGGGI